MEITELRTQLKDAMMKKDTQRLSVIRMLLSSISYAAMTQNKKDEELTSDEVRDVILKELKTRQETISELEKAGAIEKAATERAELEILKQFAPKMMDENETKEAVQKILNDAPADIQIGSAIGLVMKELKGKADPQIIQSHIKELLKK